MGKIVMNCLDEEQEIMVGGKHFNFKPRQIKFFYQDSIGHFLTTDRRDHGFVGIPEELEHLAHAKSPEALDKMATEEEKKIIEEKRREGIDAYIIRLRSQIYNLQVSLKRDLEQKNIKADPRVFASDSDVKAMELLVKYQTRKEDTDQKRVDRFKELEKQLEKTGK